MADDKFPALDPSALDATRRAAHAYSKVAGAWAKATRKKRKHWWHASLRPSLYGMTTGVIYGDTDFEIELNLAESCLEVRTCTSIHRERLVGQSSAELAEKIRSALFAAGVDEDLAPGADVESDYKYPDYSPGQANRMHRTIGSVSAVLEDFRAGIREEKSPIQIWPHHFDLSMIWLPGTKVAGQDPANEEYADKQMNFGFAFGDDGIPEPYFYVTAYPLPDDMPNVELPEGTTWRSEGFSGAVLLYDDLIKNSDPAGYLLDLWSRLMNAGRAQLCAKDDAA
ncbi:MAG: DUF5996 family protein [Woeseiaceae bacterium]|nr:DUF5996 family protein [Woeseiaceae bacterium]